MMTHAELLGGPDAQPQQQQPPPSAAPQPASAAQGGSRALTVSLAVLLWQVHASVRLQLRVCVHHLLFLAPNVRVSEL
jgi:hypothetical protein